MDHDLHKENQAGASGLTSSTPTSSALPKTPDDSIDDSAQLEAKRFATLAARIARLGGELHQSAAGGLVVRAGGAVRHFDGVAACRVFLAEVEGRS